MLYDKKWDVDATGKVLLAAADYIEKHGWCQGTFENNGKVCARGALIQSNSGLWMVSADTFTAKLRLRAYIQCHSIYTEIEYWNDAQGQTKENVIETMRAAAVFKTQE